MSETSKIKNSFSKRKYSESFGSQNSFEKSSKCSLFIPICFGIFLFHWVIFFPLVFGMLYKTIYTSHWPIYWPQLFWLVALVLYLIIMIIFMIFWRRRKIKKRGMAIENTEGISTERSKKMKTLDSIEEESDFVTLRSTERERRVLSPLVIDKKMRIDEENDLDEQKIVKSGDELSRVSREINRSSIKEYLRIVTVETPSPSGGRTCGTPMTPRDLFFMDLIQNAEREEEKGRMRGVSNVFRYDTVSGGERVEEEMRDCEAKVEDDDGIREVGKLEMDFVEKKVFDGLNTKEDSSDGKRKGVEEEMKSCEAKGEDDDDKLREVEELGRIFVEEKVFDGLKTTESDLSEERRKGVEEETRGYEAQGEDDDDELREVERLGRDFVKEKVVGGKFGEFDGLKTQRSDSYEGRNDDDEEMSEESGEKRGKFMKVEGLGIDLIEDRNFERKSRDFDDKNGKRRGSSEGRNGGDEEEMKKSDERYEKLIEIKNLKIVSTQKKLFDGKSGDFYDSKIQKSHSFQQKSGEEILEERKKNSDKIEADLTEEEKLLRIKKIDTRRYTMGSEAFQNLLGSPENRRLSKSETTLPQISEQKEEKEEIQDESNTDDKN